MAVKVKEYEVELLEFLKKAGCEEEGDLDLDFSNPAHLNNFYERYGGKEVFEKEFPDFAELVQQTVRGKCLKQTGNMILNTRGDMLDVGDLKSSVRIADTVFNADQQGALGVSNFLQDSPRIYMSMSVLKEDKVIKRSRKFLNQEFLGRIECSLEEGEYLKEKDTLTYLYNVSWQDAVTGEMHDKVKMRKNKVILSDPITEITVHHPCMYYETRIIKGMPNEVKEGIETRDLAIPEKVIYRQNDNINVAYARSTMRKDKTDYLYREVRDANGNQIVLLDFRGEVELGAGFEFECATGVYIILDSIDMPTGKATEGGGVIWYNNSIDLVKNVFKTEKGFGFVFPTNWKEAIPDSVMSSTRKYYLEADIRFKCKNSDIEYTAKVTSSDINRMEDKYGHSVKISPICFLWGCIAEGSKVRMADGSEKQIEEIKVGEKVLTAEGNTAVVMDVLEGTEKYMHLFQVQNGCLIMVSAQHPLMTQEGWKAACDITKEDSLLLENHTLSKIVTKEEIAYYGKVYNLVLDGAEDFIAEGLVVGDNNRQGMLSRRKLQTRRKAVNPALAAESAKLTEFFSV